MKKFVFAMAAAAVAFGSSPALAKDKSSGRKDQEKGTQDIPVCSRNLGVIAIVEPDNKWWREYELGSPEEILRIFVQRSRCFTLVNRGRSLQSRAMERALADSGELQRGSNIGKGQVLAADYFLEPNIVSANRNSGGSALGGVLGGVGGLLGGRNVGAIAGGFKVNKREANVTLSVVNARTTVEEALVEGYARKSDVSFGAGGGGFFGGTFAGVGGGGYQNTEIGQIIVLAYLEAYKQMVTQLGGLPEDASLDAPPAE